MAILPILEIPDPKLRLISAPVASVTDAHRQLMDDMLETMYDAPGIGLAAIQVGVPERILVIDLQRRITPVDDEGNEIEAEAHDVREPRYFVNPEIVWESEEYGVYNEGCLSVPEMYGDVERPARVRVKWLGYDGAAHEQELDGLLATCLQHEMDHLDGILFVDHLSKLKRDMIMKKLTKARKGK
ncbi:peptide deformylase [Polymorphobacter arshaanensis]|uniref:Peptide deformylase n=1 Tax=Glacieibacterium arshaanense TaxID=2511025 RepID=A0A4Y9ERJ3_9SPHN|nr:peptide deformylase [Polymorphobacter arshaanensis]TFU06261.1 peptide deformylase [Polymorphobacter arshaanensis]